MRYIIAISIFLLLAIAASARVTNTAEKPFQGSFAFDGSGEGSFTLIGKSTITGAIDATNASCGAITGSIRVTGMQHDSIVARVSGIRCGDSINGTYEVVRTDNLNHFLNGRFYGATGQGSFTATVHGTLIDAELDGGLFFDGLMSSQ